MPEPVERLSCERQESDSKFISFIGAVHARHGEEFPLRLFALTQCYQARFARGGLRPRRIGIVALARKLPIALWRYLEDGVMPQGARLIASPRTLLPRGRYARRLPGGHSNNAHDET